MRSRIVMGCIALAYVLLFVRIPRIDFQASHFTLLCNSFYDNIQGGGGRNNNFDNIPGTYIKTTKEGPRSYSYKFTDKNGDVLAKLICTAKKQYGQSWEPEDPDAFYDKAVATPNFERISAMKPNYQVLMLEPVFSPSWKDFVLETVPVLLLVILAIYRRRIKYPHAYR